MARIGCFCLSGSLAHAGRLSRLGAALQEAGHEVIFFGGPGYFGEEVVRRAGLGRVVFHPEPPLAEVLAGARGQGSPEHEVARFAWALGHDLRAVDQEALELVVVDNRRTAVVAAEARGVPALSLTTAALLGPLCAFGPTVEQARRIVAPTQGKGPAEAARWLAPREDGEVVRPRAGRLLPVLSQAIAHVGARPREYVHELCLGDRTVVLDSPGLMPAWDLPATACQPGPLLPDLDVGLPDWWGDLDPERPVVALSFGSTGDGELLATAARALVERGHQVILTAGELLDELPDGVFGARWLPGRELSERADLVVCHGGSLTVYQALGAGTPVLTMPGHIEQAMTAVAVETAGLGAHMVADEARARPMAMVDLIEALLEDVELSWRCAEASGQIDPDAALAACLEAVGALL